MLSCQSTFRQGCKRRTFLVDRKFKALQWRVANFTFNQLVHVNRYVNQGVGVHMSGDINRRTMVTGGTEGSDQHTRAESSACSHTEFYKIKNSSEDTCPGGQQSSFELPSKDGGHSQQGPSERLKTNMGLSAIEKDHSYCGVPTKSSKCDSRLRVLEFSGQK